MELHAQGNGFMLLKEPGSCGTPANQARFRPNFRKKSDTSIRAWDREKYFRSSPRSTLIYFGRLACSEVSEISGFEEIDDCSWQEAYILNRCYDQFSDYTPED